MAWTQAYAPLHSWILSTLVAALPILVLFFLLAGLRVKPHWCAMAGAGTAVVGAVTGFGVPLSLAGVWFFFRGGFGGPQIPRIAMGGGSLCVRSLFSGEFRSVDAAVGGSAAAP